MDFYTNVCRSRDKILVQGYQGNVKKKIAVAYRPKHFILSKRGQTPYKSLDGRPLGMTGHQGGLLREAPARRFRRRGSGARDAQLRRSARPRVDRAQIAQGGSRAILEGPEVPSPTARPRGMARSVGASADRYALEVRRA